MRREGIHVVRHLDTGQWLMVRDSNADMLGFVLKTLQSATPSRHNNWTTLSLAAENHGWKCEIIAHYQQLKVKLRSLD